MFSFLNFPSFLELKLVAFIFSFAFFSLLLCFLILWLSLFMANNSKTQFCCHLPISSHFIFFPFLLCTCYIAVSLGVPFAFGWRLILWVLDPDNFLLSSFIHSHMADSTTGFLLCNSATDLTVSFLQTVCWGLAEGHALRVSPVELKILADGVVFFN